MSALPPLVDPAALGVYLARELPGGEEPIEVERIRGGHSNETFYVRRGAEECGGDPEGDGAVEVI